MGPWCGQMGIGGWVGMITIWFGVVTLAIWAVTRLFPVEASPNVRVALDERLARGEIDLEAYRIIRDELDQRSDVVAGKGAR